MRAAVLGRLTWGGSIAESAHAATPRRFFIWTCVLPVIFLVWVAHVTFFIGPTHLSDRVSGAPKL